ncbi:hypothetical protein ACFQZ4_09810 [Catellatospora coxensis]
MAHARYIRDLATTSYTYTNLAVARLYDLNCVADTNLVKRSELNIPDTAPASTSMMGMRSLLLWATLHLSFPTRVAKDVRSLLPSVPAAFREMLQLRHLSPLNFADMTRIAMHYAFLQGDFRHPAGGATSFHPRPRPTCDRDRGNSTWAPAASIWRPTASTPEFSMSSS